MQRRLPESVGVYNRGVNGFGTSRDLERGHYDAVVLIFNANDMEENLDSKNGRRPYFELAEDPLVPGHQPPRPLMKPLKRLLRPCSTV